MISKREQTIKFLMNNDFYICPICKEKIKFKNGSMICDNLHTYDISKKGLICLLNTGKFKTNYIYDKQLFTYRRSFILGGFYQELYFYLKQIIEKYKKNAYVNILDLGCGEGAHDDIITNNITNDYLFTGLDYNKEAITMAIDYQNDHRNFMVSDVNSLPFKNSTFDIIINILSPYYSEEVIRVIKKDGLFIKVIPDKKYLIELRNSLGFDEYEKYDDVKNKLNNHFDIIDEITIDKKYNINKEQLDNLIHMTPLMKSKKVTTNLNNNNIDINEITVNLKILVMRGK